ncbi:MAG: protein kinase [Deltaproteobacteria bacterium]|nr:protein kinase [Deltaproteobacteria bacterium]
MPNPMPGTTLGAYRVEGTIGAGSMGEVFRGVDTGLNRRVAIKILSEKHRDSPELRARFVREGRAVAAISHPNVVQVFATGQFDERPYIAMELLDGTDLGSMVEKRGPLDSLTAAHAVLDAAQGLAAASRAGLIHRDVKPSNLVRLSDGKVKVTDFGLAKPVDPGAEPALTAMGVVVGTPDYIAPEQARGETIDERVDVYALGGTLYFILTGIPPFRTGKPAEDKYLKVVARHLRNPPPDAHQTNPGADRELADLARTMMAKKPGERPPYDALIAQLTQVVARLDPSAVPVLLASRERSRPNFLPGRPGSLDDSATLGPGVSIQSHPAGSLAPPPRPFPGWLIALTFLCLATFVAGLVVYLRRDTGPSAGATTPPPRDAASSATDADPPPAGMIPVKRANGTPMFYVDPRPVTVAAFREVFARHEQSDAADAPVTNVTYTEARSYAKTRRGRLLTKEEWDVAVVASGVVVQDGLFEWVDSPDEKQKTVRFHGKTDTRPDAKQKDVTFRMARDP